MDSWVFCSPMFLNLSWKIMLLFYRVDSSIEMLLKKQKSKLRCEDVNWVTKKFEATFEGFILNRT